MKITVELTPNELKATILNGSMYTLTETACAANEVEPEVMKLPEAPTKEEKKVKPTKTEREDPKPAENAPVEKPEIKVEAPKEEPKKENPPTDPEPNKITIVEVRTKLSTLPKEKARELIIKYDTSGSNPPKLSNVPEEKYADLLKEAEGLQ